MLRSTLVAIALTFGLLLLPAVASARPLSFGVHTPDDPLHGNTHLVDALERDIGRRIEVVSWFQSWGGEPWITRTHPHVFRAVTWSGRVPLIAWEPWRPAGGTWQPEYSLRRIASGAFDRYIAGWARALRGCGRPSTCARCTR